MVTIEDKDVMRAWIMQDTLNFTRYFFKKKSGGNRFVVGKHHRLICEKLNDVLSGKIKKLIINIAPRYSKTEIAVKNFIAMGLAMNPAARFIHLSYSGTLAQDNSIAIKDIINSEEYQALFDTRIKYGSDTKSRWDTEQGGGVYATSTLGQITGFGAGRVRTEGQDYEFAGAIVIDDPIKPQDALSDVVRESVNMRFETTIRNRVNDRDTPIIIIMQRLHERDLCGYLKGIEPEDWEVLSLPCIYQDETGQDRPLWEFKHTLQELYKIRDANSYVFETQYMQDAKHLEGLMYSKFRTYATKPMGNFIRKNYTDTADTGSDNLCSVCYDEYENGMYVTDVLYTKKPMEYTEPETSRMLIHNDTQIAYIESNNGGRGFARNVEQTVRKNFNTSMWFETFTQTDNKAVRIFTHSADVQNMIYFPEDWEYRFPRFAADLKAYRKEGRNAHDDIPDVLTGMVEKFGTRQRMSQTYIEELEDILY